MSLPSRQKFMQAKQKLDYYRLPTSFPPQATLLILKLIQKIQQKSIILTDRTQDSRQSICTSPRHNNQKPITQNHSNDQVLSPNIILQIKLKQLLRQNNLLHKQLLQSRQHIEVMKQCKQLERQFNNVINENKHSSHNIGNSKSHHALSINNEISILRNGFEILKARQIQLFEELTHVKFKYNQLMDFLHQDKGNQKFYIKRLLKHKRMDLGNNEQKQFIEIKGQNYYKSQTAYSVKDIKNGEVNDNKQIEKLNADNYKLNYLNNNLKLKIQNRQLQILRLHKKIQDQLNIQGLIGAFHLQKKNDQIKSLQNQVSLLIQRKIDTPKQNINIQQTINDSRTRIKSPNIHDLKSPPKKSDKIANNNYISIAQNRQTNESKQKTKIKSPQIKVANKLKSQVQLKIQLQTLRKQNQKLKKDIQQSKKQSKHNQKQQQTNKQPQQQMPLKNQFIKNSRKTQQHISTLQTEINQLKDVNQKLTNINLELNKQFSSHNEQISLLNKQLQQKQTQIKKIQLRWKDAQQENRILIQELSEKRRYVESLIKKNLYVQQQESHKNIKSNNNNKQYNNSPQQQFKKSNLKTTNAQTTHLLISNNNLLYTTNNMESINGGNAGQNGRHGTKINKNNNINTPIYSPSQYEKSQKNTIFAGGYGNNSKIYSQKIEIDLKSQNQSNINYPSNIHSKISQQKQSKQSKKSENISRLQDIQQKQEDSLEKSHHSDQERRSRLGKSRQKNNGGIRISITNNNKETQEKYYDNKGYNEKQGSLLDGQQSHRISSLKGKQYQHDQIIKQSIQKEKPLSKNNQVPIKNKTPHNQQSNQILNNTQKNQNILSIDDSDKASVFSMRQQIDQLKLDHRKQLKHRKKLQTMFKQSQQQRQKLQDQIQELQAKINQLQQQQQLQKSPNKFNIRQQQQQSSSSKPSQVDRKLHRKLKQQQERITQLEQQNIQTQLKVRDRDNRIKQFQGRIQSLLVKIQELNNKIKKMDDENEQLIIKYQKLLVLADTKKQQQQVSNNDNGNAISSNIPSSLQQINNHTTKNYILTSQPGNTSNQILWLKKQISTLELKIQKYNQTITQLNDYISIHRQEKEKLSIEKLNALKENQYLKKKMMQLQRALNIQADGMFFIVMFFRDEEIQGDILVLIKEEKQIIF